MLAWVRSEREIETERDKEKQRDRANVNNFAAKRRDLLGFIFRVARAALLFGGVRARQVHLLRVRCA